MIKQMPDTIEELLSESGKLSKFSVTRTLNYLRKANITDPLQLLILTREDLEEIGGISEGTAKRVYDHLAPFRGMGSNLQQTLKIEYQFLRTGIDSLDRELSFGYNKAGLRSRTITSIEGHSGTGKSMLCKSLAMQFLQSNSGFTGKVLYISSSTIPQVDDLLSLNQYHQIEESELRARFVGFHVTNMDDLDLLLGDLNQLKDFQMIIIDNIIDMIAEIYPAVNDDRIYNKSSVISRDKVLNSVFLKLRRICFYLNSFILITNKLVFTHEGPNHFKPYQAKLGDVLDYYMDLSLVLDIPTIRQKSRRMEMSHMFEAEGAMIIDERQLTKDSELYREFIKKHHIISIYCKKSSFHGRFIAHAIMCHLGVLDQPYNKQLYMLMSVNVNGAIVSLRDY